MKTKRKHSAGPWEAGSFVKADGSDIKTVGEVMEVMAHSARQSGRVELWGVNAQTRSGERTVCYTGNGPTSEANARLIAAAPDLLAALQEIEQADITESIIFGETFDWIGRFQSIARAAIARAEGQT